MNGADTQGEPQRVRSVVVGTAGHIDHGKTSLVLALTGTDTDRLPEEKRRGITIDLGFAALRLTGPQGETIELSLIDVPGHHAYLQNMMAGTAGTECVLLVIAADEGVRAQTREHLSICTLLGVRQGIVALTKVDAVTPERVKQVTGEVRAFLASTPLRAAPIVPLSSRTGQGIDALKKGLARLAAEHVALSSGRALRLPLDRAFSIAGFGTVTTGTLFESMLGKGETLELQPMGRTVRVRGLQVHRQSVDQAHAATRVAVNLTGADVADVHRGDVLVRADTVVPTNVLDVELTALDEDAFPFRHRSIVGMHALSSESSARLLLYEEVNAAASSRLARLRLVHPMVLAPGDCFVIRQPSPARILGGGRVLDAQPDMRVRKAATRRWLETIRSLEPAQQILERVRRAGAAGIASRDLVRQTGLSLHAVHAVVSALCAENTLIDAGERYLAPAALQASAQRVMKELDARAEHSGARAELLSKTGLKEWVFDLAVAHLERERRVRVASGQISLAAAEREDAGRTELLDRVESLYRAAGLTAPVVDEVATKLHLQPKQLTPLLTLLLRAGKLVRMGEDRLLIHADALAKLRSQVSLLRGQTLDVPRFKELTGLTRKYAIPLLEYLDGSRVTRNHQGVRTVL